MIPRAVSSSGGSALRTACSKLNGFLFQNSQGLLQGIENDWIVGGQCLFLWTRMALIPASSIWSMWSFSRMVSRSMITSVRSMETTSPVSSSTKPRSRHEPHGRPVWNRPTLFRAARLTLFPGQVRRSQGYPYRFQIRWHGAMSLPAISFSGQYTRTSHCWCRL